MKDKCTLIALGPGESIRRDGSFGFVIKGTAPGGKVQKVSVHGKGDPGYRATGTFRELIQASLTRCV